MDFVEKEITIRKLRAEDADEISEIYCLITNQRDSSRSTQVKNDWPRRTLHHPTSPTYYLGDIPAPVPAG